MVNQCRLVKVWSAGSGSPPNKEGTFRPQGRNGGGWLFAVSRADAPETTAGIKFWNIKYQALRFNHPRSKTCFASFSNVPSLLGGEPEPALQTLTKQHWMLNLHFSQHQFLGQKGLDGTMESFWMNISFFLKRYFRQSAAASMHKNAICALAEIPNGESMSFS